jgi:hypothetical protein
MGITVNEAGRRRWRGVGKEVRPKLAGKAAGSYWAKLTPDERSVEMKRRAKVRERNRAAKAKGNRKTRQELSARLRQVAIKNAAGKSHR